MTSEVERRVLNCYKEIMGCTPSCLPHYRWESQMDSLDEIEFLMCLEEEFDIEINDSDAENWNSLLDVINYIQLRA